ncbi:MAG: hypothetical protein AAGI07_06545 [Bacteroidota bacterium]
MNCGSKIYLLFLVVITACDSTLEDLEKLDSFPVISLKLDLERDSIKISDKVGTKVYQINFTISGEGAESLTIGTSTNSLGVFSSIQKREEEGTVYSVSYTPNAEGWHELKIKAKDRFKRIEEVSFALFAFENLPPKGLLAIEKLPDTNFQEYLFDASKSYDMDEKYGGLIRFYRFFIGNNEITLEESELKFVFPQNIPAAKIGLQVMDNDGSWSERVEEEINF